MIIGHEKQWQFLKKMIEMGRVPHALLFSGPSQLGKRTLANEFSKVIISQENLENHPDFISISPEGSKDIQISEIRNLIWKLSLRPYSAFYKIAVIDKAHQMNQEAQNCFLKTLEEPRGKSVLILITEHPETLAPTILSRVQRIRFFPVKKSEIENFLIKQGLSKEKAEYLSSFSLGKPGLALNFLEDSEKIKNQEKIVSDIEKISQSDFSSRFQYAKEISDSNIREILDIWLNHFRNLLYLNLNSTQVRPVSADTGLTCVSYSLGKLKKIIKLIQSTDYLIFTTNVNSKLALEILLMEL